MSTLVPDLQARATNVRFDADRMFIHLADGRELSIPLGWFPRLLHATSDEREQWRLIGRGSGIHWEAVDEDISIPQLLGLPCE